MLFNSLQFVWFFPATLLVFFALPAPWQRWWLLACSCVFYMAFVPWYILIILLTICIDYTAGIWIEQTVGKRRKLLLIASLCSNLLILAVFKYYNFFVAHIEALYTLMGLSFHAPYSDMVLPVGLSFHTFQAMSYTIEVYKGRQPAERNFAVYWLYVMFFPQMVAGPIERPQRLIHQFHEHKKAVAENLRSGLKWMLLGFIKKILIADKLALVVNEVYGHSDKYGAGEYALATCCFAFQIYFDFSGYSDIALGAARCMGYTLMKNFRTPYLSASAQEFWRRWHISLSSWFRDYVYVPLGGSRVSKWKQRMNLMFVFALSGLWHGANYTFVIWGMLNGLLVMIFPDSVPRNTLSRWLRVCFTFALVCITWIFFRAESVQQGMHILGSMVSFNMHAAYPLAERLQTGLSEAAGFAMAGVMIVVLHIAETMGQWPAACPRWLR